MLNQQQARALANFTTLLRPDWNADGIYSALGRCKDRDPFATALATIRAAWDDGAKTPGVIPTEGPHWREMAGVAPKSTDPRPPRRDEECPLHAGQWADKCHGCAADRLTDTRTTPPELRRPDRANHIARARADLRAALARLCSHGINRDRATCRECERPAPAPDQPTEPEETTDA